jgi:hypothetical protein
LDGFVNYSAITGQRYRAIAAGQRGRIKRFDRIRCTRLTSPLDCCRAAIKSESFFDSTAVWWIKGQTIHDASVALGVAYGPGCPQLPLGPLGVAAILLASKGTAVIEGPHQKFGRLHT